MNDYIEINGIGWERTDDDIITAYNAEGVVLGLITQDGDTPWEDLLAGGDPIGERWEDGCGNTVSVDGWGAYCEL